MQPAPEATFSVAVSTYSLRQKIAPGSAVWPTFNGSFENRQLSRLDLADAIYTGHAFTTWHKNHWRNAANFQLGGHLALDFDTEDARSTLPSLLGDKFIGKYGSLIYTTVSHTPEAPKARAVFLLDTPIQQSTNYTLAAQSLLWLFGSADRQCKDSCRFFYGSAGCQMEYLENVLPLDTVKHLIAQYKETGQREKRRQDWQHTTTADQQEVADALRKIPAWGIPYDDWLAVLMALHHEYGDGGLALAESWADGAPREVERKWAGFAPHAGITSTVSIATVFGLAKKFGWHKAT